jgi:iron complex transport system substrate-binding protein
MLLSALCLLCCMDPSERALAAAPAAGGQAVEVIDDSGNPVRLDAPARRIVVLYAGFGDTLAAMGLTGYVAGRTVSDDTLPPTVPAVGTHMRPNMELVAALHPDLALLLEGREEAGATALSLGRLGIPVARFRVSSFDDLFSCIGRLGTLTGEQTRAEILLADMRERLDAVRRKTATLARRPTVFFEVRYPNLLGAGGRSMPADIIRAAGGIHCLDGENSRMVRLNEERLLLLNPDIYLIQEGAMNKNPIPLEDRSHFRALSAVRNAWSFTVPESRFSRPGPQSVSAVEELADIILRRYAGKRRMPESEQPDEGWASCVE